MPSGEDNPKYNPIPKEILPGQAYMARSNRNRWPELYHWLTGRQTSPSSQVQKVSSTPLSSQLRESSPHQVPASNEDPTQPHQGSQATLDKSGDDHPVEDEYLRLNEELTPSTANAEPESSHPVRRRRKAAEEDPWTASLEKAGGVDYYRSVSSPSAPSGPSQNPASSHASVSQNAEEKPSQKQQSGPRSAHGPAKDGAKRSNEASSSYGRQKPPGLDDALSKLDEGNPQPCVHYWIARG